MAITTTTHKVYLVRLDSKFQLNQLDHEPVAEHTQEVWCAAFGVHEDPLQKAFILYSGADDSLLSYISCTVDPSYTNQSVELSSWLGTPLGSSTTVRGHEAGVTTILPTPVLRPDGSRLVLTGCYDGRLRAWDFPPPNTLQRARPVGEGKIAEGVWRLRLVDSHCRLSGGDRDTWELLVLASCTHSGARIVKVKGDLAGSCDVEVVAIFQEHESMNYASDFQPGMEDGLVRCVSTSFYDKLVCLWTCGPVERGNGAALLR